MNVWVVLLRLGVWVALAQREMCHITIAINARKKPTYITMTAKNCVLAA